MGDRSYKAAVHHLGDDNCFVDPLEFSNSGPPSRPS